MYCTDTLCGGWWFWVSLVYAISFLHPTQSINWSNFKRVNDVFWIACCWTLDNSAALSCLPRPWGSACRNRRHASHAGFDPQSPLAWTVLLYSSMVNVTRACMHVSSHPLICVWAATMGCAFRPGADVPVPSYPLNCIWAAAKGCECEWNCCWHLQLQGISLTHVLWLNCFL